MRKKYKTVKSLGKVWSHIDNALSEINLALEDLDRMSLPSDEREDAFGGLKQKLERFDQSELVSIKTSIEELIEEKDENYFRPKQNKY